MKSRKQYLTEPGDQRWMHASTWAAAAGGILIILLLLAMAVFTPGERPAGRLDRADATAVETPVAAVPLPPLPGATEAATTPEEQPPTF
jgi:hypothetical protein